MSDKETRVLIVVASASTRTLLKQALTAVPGTYVVATADTSDGALRAIGDHNPNVMIVDVGSSGLDGLAVITRVMQENPVPIVAVSGAQQDHVSASFRALEAGALALVRTPASPGAVDTIELLRMVRLMSEVKVVRRSAAVLSRAVNETTISAKGERDTGRNVRVIAIGASTGGPAALSTLLRALPANIRQPVLVVQHIATGFTQGLVSWLDRSSGHKVQMAKDGEKLVGGEIYIAPEDLQMGVSSQGRVRLDDAPAENGLRPSVSYLFRSVREAYGSTAAAVLLTGMGKDGAQELLDLRQSGAVTYAQDKESSLIFGMPGEAVRLGAALYIMAPAQIGAALGAFSGRMVPEEA